MGLRVHLSCACAAWPQGYATCKPLASLVAQMVMCLLFNMLSRLASRVAQLVKNLPAMRETWVRSLGREVPLEKEMATHSSILASRIPRTEQPGRL